MTEASQSENIVLLFTLIMQNLLINVLHSLKHSLKIAFIALTLLAEHQEEHLVCKNSVIRSWCGYLSEARSRLFAYGPAEWQLPFQNPITDWFYLSGTGLSM